MRQCSNEPGDRYYLNNDKLSVQFSQLNVECSSNDTEVFFIFGWVGKICNVIQSNLCSHFDNVNLLRSGHMYIESSNLLIHLTVLILHCKWPFTFPNEYFDNKSKCWSFQNIH